MDLNEQLTQWQLDCIERLWSGKQCKYDIGVTIHKTGSMFCVHADCLWLSKPDVIFKTHELALSVATALALHHGVRLEDLCEQ